MPLIGSELLGQYWEPCATGPVVQIEPILTDPNLVGATLPTTGTIAASGNWLSNPIVSDGFKSISVAAKSTQVGAINIQRYLDRAGTMPVSAVATVALAANVANFLTVVDDVAYQSFTVQITNTGGSPATITNFGILLAAK